MTRSGAGQSIWLLPEPQAVEAVGERLVDLPRIRVTGILYRGMDAECLRRGRPQPLFYKGSVTGRRYTPPGGPAGLYLAFDAATPTAELRLVVFEDWLPASSAEHDPVTLVAVRAKVGRILDLTNSRTRKRLTLTKPMLLADWETQQKAYLKGSRSMSATQLLALAAHALGTIAGVKYPSAKTPFGENLVVFPDRLRASIDSLEVVDSTGHFLQRLP